jgi:hypothetical protein
MKTRIEDLPHGSFRNPAGANGPRGCAGHDRKYAVDSRNWLRRNSFLRTCPGGIALALCLVVWNDEPEVLEWSIDPQSTQKKEDRHG